MLGGWAARRVCQTGTGWEDLNVYVRNHGVQHNGDTFEDEGGLSGDHK